MVPAPCADGAGGWKLNHTILHEAVAPAGPQSARMGVPGCVREDALSAGWKSLPHEVTSCVVESNCVAVRRGGEQQETKEQPVGNEPDTAEWHGEPARVGRSLEIIGCAGVTVKATSGCATWVGMGCPEGRAEQAERPAGLGEGGRSQSPHITAMRRPAPWRRAASINRLKGRGAGRWMREDWNEARASTVSAGNG